MTEGSAGELSCRQYQETMPPDDNAPKPVRRRGRIVNALSVDVEEHFQVQAFAGIIQRADWQHLPSRVQQNTEKVLQIFADANVKGTFFTLGWIAERNPSLIRRIVDEGHELACHGQEHIRVDCQSPAEFREDIVGAKKTLEDTGSVAVQGYRAATFSINPTMTWAFDELANAGFRYSSSIYPVKHDLYGSPDAPRTAFRPNGLDGALEIPISTLRLGNRNFPFGGGGYFRLFPYTFAKWGLGRINAKSEMPCVFYFHPWEVDPQQPRPEGLPLKSRFRHYLNLNRMETRLSRLCRDFEWDRGWTARGCHQQQCFDLRSEGKRTNRRHRRL